MPYYNRTTTALQPHYNPAHVERDPPGRALVFSLTEMSENNPGADTWQTVRDFVAADPELQRYMQLSFDAFHQTGDWPDVEKLQRQLLRENDSLDLYAVGDRIPSEIGTNPIRIDNHCQLTVAGVALCNGADEEVRHFVSALRIAARMYLGCCTPLSIGMGGIARGTTWSVSGWVSLKGEVAPLSGSGVAP
jgi:hypothetical protein